MAENRFNLVPDKDRMIPYDISTNFDGGCCVILELKCFTTQVPLWMIDCIRMFNLQRRSFSKYATGIAQVFTEWQYADMGRMPVLR